MTKRCVALGLGLLTLAALAQTGPRDGGKFARLDRNKDGVIVASELPNKALFDKLDADHDGKITRVEAARAALVLRHASSPKSPPVAVDKAEGMRVFRNVAYTAVPKGVDAKLLSLDVYSPAEDGKKHPLVVMLHGGGWGRGDKTNEKVVTAKSRYFVAHGYVFVSVNYRLTPDVTPLVEAADVASAIAFLKKEGGKYGGDPGSIVLMGHSAGAHLAALVATDPSYLKAHGLAPTDLSAVILLDGAAYNLPAAMGEKGKGGIETSLYQEAFGNDPSMWAKASPTLQAGQGRMPPFLIFHAGGRASAEKYSVQLAEAITNGGGKATVVDVPDKNHAEINHDIGTVRDGIGQKILEFTQGL